MFHDKHGLMRFFHHCPLGIHLRGEVSTDTSNDSPCCGMFGEHKLCLGRDKGRLLTLALRVDGSTGQRAMGLMNPLLLRCVFIGFSVRTNSFDVYISLGSGAEKVLLTCICL